MEFVDLHVHSTASDGSLDPIEIVEEALELGLYAIAITDHDTVAGVPYAIEAAKGTPLNIIPGVEISTTYNGREIHVLGYNIDIENKLLNETLDGVAQLHLERNDKMCQLMREHGVDISLEKLYENSHSRLLTRGNMGHYLIEHGYAADMAEAFEKYIGINSDCYIPKFKLSLDDVYKVITYAGGICSLAHPVQYHLDDEGYKRLFLDLKSLGFGCVEAIHSDNEPGDQKRFTDLAESLGLSITGGSDFHGLSKPDICIGTGKGNLMIPKSILKNIGIMV